MRFRLPGTGLLGGVEIEIDDSAINNCVGFGPLPDGPAEEPDPLAHYASELKAAIAAGLDAIDGYIETDGWSLFQHPDIPRDTEH